MAAEELPEMPIGPIMELHGQRKRIHVPRGLKPLLEEMIREVLRYEPDDIYDFLAKYMDAKKGNLPSFEYQDPEASDNLTEQEIDQLFDDMQIARDTTNRYSNKIQIKDEGLVQEKFNYPQVRRDESVIDDYHGTTILDPYRWLEDADSEETQQFVEAQNNLTFSYLEKAPQRELMRETLTKYWNYPKQGLPMQHGDKYYIYKNSGIQNHAVLYTADTLEELESNPEVFLDPNTFSEDGTVALSEISFSKDGQLLAYSVTESGSDWSNIHIKDISTGQDFPEVLNFTKFTTIAWTHDNLGFLYTRPPPSDDEMNKMPESTKNEKIYYHHIGTPQDEDTLVFEFLDQPEWTIGMEITNDGEYLYVYTSSVINEDYIFYTPLGEAIEDGFQSKLTLVPLVIQPASYTLITNDGPLFYFLTNEGAPNFHLIAMDVNNCEKDNWTILIPEDEHNVLNFAYAVDGDKLMTSYLKDVKSTLELRHLHDGVLIEEFPLENVSIQNAAGKREDNIFYFETASFANPGISYKIDLTMELPVIEPYHEVQLNDLDTSKFITTQVFYKSKDGTEVPMFITHKEDLELSGDNPTLLYAYGGFSSNIEPFFSIGFLTFVNNFNGVLAVANIRGGGEYGTNWWDGGRLLNKQNSFDDFAAGAEYLIANNYTNPSKLTIQGGSNGGLLIGVILNQRPELFGAGIPEVGVMDMLRFQNFTDGSIWCGEYGCSEDKTYFENLITFSPLHNIRLPPNGVQYPAVLVTTADHDDRVVPLHSYKYIAELQHAIGQSETQKNPLMIRIEKKAGHGHGKPTTKQIEALVDIYSFLSLALGYESKNV